MLQCYTWPFSLVHDHLNAVIHELFKMFKALCRFYIQTTYYHMSNGNAIAFI